MLKPRSLFININMNQYEQKHRKQNLNVQVHDVKSSLQSLMLASELLLEGSDKFDDRSINLLETMMNDIKKVVGFVNRIESDYVNRRDG